MSRILGNTAVAIGVLAAAGALAGCAVGPNFHAPTLPPVAPPAALAAGPVDAQATQQLDPSAPLPQRWWTLFGSPGLDALVDEALRANPDLKAANATLREARALLRVARSGRLSSVEAHYEAERSRVADALSPPLYDEAFLYSLHTAQVSVAYRLDLFGARKRGVESAKAQGEAARFQFEAARLSLISNTVLAALEAASLRQQQAQVQGVVDVERTRLALFERRHALGDEGAADVAGQRAVLAQAQADLSAAAKALAQQETALAVLLGRDPLQGPPPAIDLGGLSLPQNLPVSLPDRLVRQRPDVRAAEAEFHAASANVGVAIAARLPDIVLSADLGDIATRFGDLFAGGNGFWTLLGGVTQPVFQGGALRQQQRAAEAGLERAKAQYRSAVLAAFQDVADTLSALRKDAAAAEAAERAEQALAQRLGFVRRQHALGEVGAGEEMDALIAYQAAKSAWVAAQTARYADTAALFQALGGGWDQPTNVTPPRRNAPT